MGLAVVAVAECRIGQILPWHLFESEREAVGAPAAGLECCFAAWQIEGSAGMAVAAAAAEEVVDVAAAVVAAAAMNQRELGVILRSYERWTLKLGAGCLRQMLA